MSRGVMIFHGISRQVPARTQFRGVTDILGHSIAPDLSDNHAQFGRVLQVTLYVFNVNVDNTVGCHSVWMG